MRYTWRITLTTIILLVDAIYLDKSEFFTLKEIVEFLVNGTIVWVVGYQFDKYRYSKRELDSTKTVLFDYSYALDSTGEAIGILNEKGQFEFVNDAHAQLYGYSKEELLTRTWRNCYSKETINDLQYALTNLVQTGHWKGETVGIRQDGTTFPQELTLSLITNTNKTICVVRDITGQKQYEKYMMHIAEHNALTNLPNRRRLLSDLEKSKQELRSASILLIDLNQFKFVNDTIGHENGDDLLVLVGKRLTAFNNEFTNIYHNGGDEFFVLVQNNDIEVIKNVTTEIIKKINDPFQVNGNEVNLTASVGISCYPNHTNQINDLLKMADTAMYYAQIEGKNTFKIFNKDLKLKLERRGIIETELTKAISNNEFFLCYQPKINLINRELVGIEALIRWKNSKLGMVSPMEFIPIAEDTGVIIGIGNWVIKEALNQMGKWRALGYPSVKMSVNVSQRQFREEKFVNFIDNCLNLYHIDSHYFEIEITESVMEDLDLVIPKLNLLKEIGVGISIDDFGTGYSSLKFLKDLPIDTLKIDQSFIRDLLGDTDNNLLVKSIIEIGNILNLNVIAEGIETEEHLDLLVQSKCSIGQGYYFSKPIPTSEFETSFFKSEKSLLNTNEHGIKYT